MAIVNFKVLMAVCFFMVVYGHVTFQLVIYTWYAADYELILELFFIDRGKKNDDWNPKWIDSNQFI